MPDAFTHRGGGSLPRQRQLSLGQLSDACGVHAEFIISLVEEGIIDPIDSIDSTWAFEPSCFARVRSVLSLQKDLGVNLPGVALALDLMQEIEDLKAELNRIKRPH